MRYLLTFLFTAMLSVFAQAEPATQPKEDPRLPKDGKNLIVVSVATIDKFFLELSEDGKSVKVLKREKTPNAHVVKDKDIKVDDDALITMAKKAIVDNISMKEGDTATLGLLDSILGVVNSALKVGGSVIGVAGPIVGHVVGDVVLP